MLSVTLYQIEGILYRLSNEDIKEGDLVYDIRNNTYGIADMVTDHRIAVKDGNIIEGIPKTSAFKLVPAPVNN